MPSQNQTDDYYKKKTLEAIEKSLLESIERGRTPDETRFYLRRAYCFGSLRKGRPYKIWQKHLLAKEAELGYEPKKHIRTLEKEQAQMNSVAAKTVKEPVTLKVTRAADTADNPAWQEFLDKNPRPISKEMASRFLRSHCQTTLAMREDCDLLRVVLKYSNSNEDGEIKWQFSRELQTDDEDEWNLCFMEAACQAHSLWLDSHKAKY